MYRPVIWLGLRNTFTEQRFLAASSFIEVLNNNLPNVPYILMEKISNKRNFAPV